MNLNSLDDLKNLNLSDSSFDELKNTLSEFQETLSNFNETLINLNQTFKDMNLTDLNLLSNFSLGNLGFPQLNLTNLSFNLTDSILADLNITDYNLTDFSLSDLNLTDVSTADLNDLDTTKMIYFAILREAGLADKIESNSAWNSGYRVHPDLPSDLENHPEVFQVWMKF